MCQWLVTVVGVVFMINIARESQVRTVPVWDWCFLCRHSYNYQSTTATSHAFTPSPGWRRLKLLTEVKLSIFR